MLTAVASVRDVILPSMPWHLFPHTSHLFLFQQSWGDAHTPSPMPLSCRVRLCFYTLQLIGHRPPSTAPVALPRIHYLHLHLHLPGPSAVHAVHINTADV